jgi:hypothetical protein
LIFELKEMKPRASFRKNMTIISIAADARNPTREHFLKTAVVVITMSIAENECC